ncbi:MAG: sensor histidine kinase [Oligoflexales bacterium]
MNIDYYYRNLIEYQEILNKQESIKKLTKSASSFLGTVTKCQGIWFLIYNPPKIHAIEIYQNGNHEIKLHSEENLQKYSVLSESKFLTFNEGSPILDWINPHNGSRYAYACSSSLLGYGCRIAYFYDDLDKQKSDPVVTHFANFFLTKFAYILKVENLLDEKEKMTEEIRLRNRILCHDLSNYIMKIRITSIKGQKELVHEENVKMWNKVARIAKNQAELVKYVRNLEALSSGKKQYTLEPVCIRSLIEEASFLFEDTLKEKDIEIVHTMKQEEEYLVLADKTSLSNQVINNVISNAIKFSPKNSKITINFNQTKPGEIKLSIIDQGIGMPEKIKNNLFSFTDKTTRSGTMNEKGTGFGMPLVKAFMDSFNGKVEVETKEKSDENDLEHGTTFHLFFKDGAI